MIDKNKRIVSKKAIETARLDYCEYCFRHTKIDSVNIGHVHHIKSKGSGGDDAKENLIHLCYLCHDLAHRGKISKEKLRKIKGG